MSDAIPFNRPHIGGREIDNLRDALSKRELQGNGHYTRICHEWLKRETGAKEALLTHSCTSALEMAAILCNIGHGDEVIMPSYTFVSTANAVVLRGGVPVFVDIRKDTLNIDETLIEGAITPRTKAIFAVHYAGVPCEMDEINRIAKQHNLLVVEDAAQALLSSYKGRAAGSLGDIACFSFHATKNVISGEGGAIIINRENLAERAHIVWEKGTNRRAFHKGEVDKYTWVDIGSSFLPSELTAAFLAAQLEEAQVVTNDRLKTWGAYHQAFEALDRNSNELSRPSVPANTQHNAHLYYLLLLDQARRDNAIADLRKQNIHSPFHYVPLHSSPAGIKFGRPSGPLPVTENYAKRLIRLPLFAGIGRDAERAAEALINCLRA